jgi:hypothetical protein
MLNRSIVSYYPSGDPNSASSNEYLLFSSSPTLHDGNMYFCMAHVVLSLAGTPGTNDWDLRASTKAVRVVMIPSNAAPPWSDPSPDVYRIVAEAFQNAWSCASANIDNGHFIGVRKVLAASFHSNSMFQVPIAVFPGPGHEADQNVLVRCRAGSSLETSPVMFAHAVSINRTHSTCNVVLFQRRSGQESIIVTAQDSGGILYGGSNESVASFSVVVTSSNFPPRFSFRSIHPCSYDGNVGNVTVNMSTSSVPVKLENLVVGLTAGCGNIEMSAAVASGHRLLQLAPTFTDGGLRSLNLPLTPFLFGRLTLIITAKDNCPGGLSTSTSRSLYITILSENNPPFCQPSAPLQFRRSSLSQNYSVDFIICPGPGDEVHSQTASANFDGHLVSGFNATSAFSSSGCPIYQVLLHIPGGFYGNTSQLLCSAVDSRNSTAQSFHNVSILYVNSQPSFRIVEDHFSLSQSSLNQSIRIVLEDATVGSYDGDQILNCSLRDVNMSFFAYEPVLTPDFPEFHYVMNFSTASLYTTGKTNFNFVCSDNGGNENGGINYFSKPVFLNITLVNLPPYFNLQSRIVTASQDSLLVTVPGFVYHISQGQPSEHMDRLEFAVTTDNPSLFAELQIVPSWELSTAKFIFKPAAHLFGVANVTITLTEVELKSNQLGDLTLLQIHQTFRLVVLPTSPYPDFNISNSTINVLEDFGEMTFVKFVPSFDFGGGESNAEVPVYFEFRSKSVV